MTAGGLIEKGLGYRPEVIGVDAAEVLMLKFAAYHVKKALEAAAEKAKLSSNEFIGTSFQKTRCESPYSMNDGWYFDVDKDSILNAYKLEEIK